MSTIYLLCRFHAFFKNIFPLSSLFFLHFISVGCDYFCPSKKFSLLILNGVNSSCRSLPGLALAGDLQLHPAYAAHGLHVLHAGDAPVPAVKGQEAGGRGGSTLPARTRRPHRMGVRPH